MNSTSRSTDSSPPSGSSNSSSTTPPQTPAPSNSSSSVPPQSPPPTTPPPSSPPPSPTIPPSSPPPSPPTSSPPSRRKSPPPSPASPPPANSPPPTTSPPSSETSAPEATPAPPVTTPPASPSPPPPEKVSSPPSNSSSPPIKKPRETAPPNNRVTPPPSDSLLAPPLSTSTSPTSTPSPPFSSSSSPPLISPAPPDYVNETLPTKPLPSFPKGKPPAESITLSPNATSNAKSTDAGGIKTGGVVAIGIVVGFLAVGLVVWGVWFTRRQKKGWAGSKVGYQMPSPSSQNSDSLFLKHQNLAPLAGSTSGRNCLHSPDGGVGNSKSWFAYEELAEATNGFSSQNLLGEGGFGCVYKGSLVDGREVAVKQLKIGGGQGEREFRAEVETISRIHHRHLVSLVGYCISNDQRLLVYDYVPNNTLYYHLHGQGRPLMGWETRVKVAAGAARGIAYLHEDCHPRIIHRDIKSSNILIDDNFEAQVADFGLAKLALDANTHVTTRVMGTFGYMAPEYAASGKLTEKSDVFSFGVVLLELITGRKPVDTSLPLGDESLVEWARPLLAQALKNEEFNRLADPKLENKFVEEEMFRMMEAAAACVRHLASKRPRMSQVVRALDSINLDITNGMKPGQSEVFDSRQQSAEIRLFRRMAFGSKEWDSDFFNTESSWE